MAKYTQKDRVFRVSVPSLGEDVLLLEGFSGQEQVSEPFEFTLEVVSEDDSIDAAAMLREPFIVQMRLPDGSDRQIHGLCGRFTQHGKDEELTSYEAEIVPWLQFLSLNQDCKIFQEMTVLEIIEEVFGKYDAAEFEVKCVGTFEPRDYCVQYRESDLNFVSRLMEEEGIFYFFEHSESGHKLILADDRSAVGGCTGQSKFRVTTTPDTRIDEDVITELEREHKVYTNAITLTDYDPLQPSLDLETSDSDDDHEEHYDYPGKYTELSAGEKYASFLLEERAACYEIARGIGTCRAFRSGHTFDLSEHYRSDTNQSYFLLDVRHSGHGGGYRSKEQQTEYINQFECMPATVPYRPPRKSIKPTVQGSQTAVVVGPSGEEIYTDKHGRVKVQFYWDRDGKKDENSSCWIRVSHPWAGKGWGAIHNPRIGQEVIVDFLEGDPDRPIITGRVYNAEQTPPYGLPSNQTQSGLKSRSSKKGGTSNFNEIRMEDKKGSEQLYIHAEKDKQVVVENDRDESVGNDETISIGRHRTETVGKNETIDIGNDRTETVGDDEKITIGKSRTESVGTNETITVGGNQSEKIGKNQTLSVGKNQSESIGKNQSLDVGDSRSTDVGKNDTLQVGKNLVIDAGDQITIKTGKASIVMKKDGTIQISGKDLTIKGSGKINIKASKDIVMKGKKILQN